MVAGASGPDQSRDVLEAKGGAMSAMSGKVQLGPRPYFLINDMDDSELKDELLACGNRNVRKSDFSIGHRGAGLQFPEHTEESYRAAARMGAGIVECDVTFTKDQELVCRHSQCDLHTTTNILATPLASKCSSQPDYSSDTPFANVQCCTSDITLAEFKSLQGKMDAANSNATNLAEYLNATPAFRTDLYSAKGTLMSHAESIALFQELGVKFTPELKSPSVAMPFDGLTQQAYAQKMLDEYKAAGVNPNKVWAQSFNVDDVRYWIANEPAFGAQAVYLDGRYDNPAFDHTDPSTWQLSMAQLVEEGVNIIAPPMWMLLALDDEGEIVPSIYAKAAKDAGLDIITWTLERSGLLQNGGGWYHQTVTDAIVKDGDTMVVLDVLAQDVGVIGVFSDWPAAVTYYANCKGL
ncbi:MAG: glycerophosphodiester phosphodiesterase [Gammaproteobacteria bacterium]|nr:glycerophosphodiester phosphodiesterase [Gammaproteobacteria bacterium]MBQ0840124.1 glycerophosphodiester phosphodiesterase [Gammaproteobacteria bacterium]